MKTKVNDISIPDKVILPFRSEEPLFPGRMFGAAVHEIRERDDLGTNKSSLHIAMNLTGRFWSRRSLRDGPGS